MDKTNRKVFQLSIRQFLKGAAVAGVSLAIPLKFGVRSAYPFAQSPTNIRKFVTTLPGLGPLGINNFGQYLPLATKTTQIFAGLPTDVYNIAVAEFAEQMHPDLPGPTHFWGYHDGATGDQKYLAGVIVARRGTPVLFNLSNQLPNKTLIPVDPTLMAGPNGLTVRDLPPNRIVNPPARWLYPVVQRRHPFPMV